MEIGNVLLYFTRFHLIFESTIKCKPSLTISHFLIPIIHRLVQITVYEISVCTANVFHFSLHMYTFYITYYFPCLPHVKSEKSWNYSTRQRYARFFCLKFKLPAEYFMFWIKTQLIIISKLLDIHNIFCYLSHIVSDKPILQLG